MSVGCWVLVAILGGDAPVHAVAPHNAAAWVYAPDVGGALQAAEATPFGALLPAVMPKDVRTALREEKDVALVGAVTLPRGKRPHGLLIADAGAAAGPWLQHLESWMGSLGFTAGEGTSTESVQKTPYSGRGVDLVAFRQGARIGVAPPAIADAPTASAMSPLSTTPAFLEQWARAPTALVRGHVNVPKVYGWLARQPKGRELASLITRLGFASLRRVDGAARTRGKSIHSTLSAEIGGKTEGLLAAMGPPQTVRSTQENPKELLGATMMSIHPRRVLPVIGRVANLYGAMQWTLFQSQLETVEKRKGVILTDALGDDVQVWTVTRWAAGGREAMLLDAPVASPNKLHTLIEAFLEMVPNMAAGTKVTRTKQGSTRIASITRANATLASIAFTKDGVMVSNQADVFRKYETWKRGTKAGKEQARVWGYRNDAADVPRLLRRFGLAGRLGVHRKAVEGAFGRSTWTLRRAKGTDGGHTYTVDVYSSGR